CAAALIRAVLAPLDGKRVRFGTRRISADLLGDRAQLGGRERKRLAACEALEFVVRRADDCDWFGRKRDGIQRDGQFACAFPFGVTPGELPPSFIRASDSMTFARLRYCKNSTRP